MNSNQWQEPKELRIPVTYGHIAAKVWGNEQGENVLALHGWQDNAGTFDKLIPLLTPNLHIVAIDAPGHGLSSHKPLGAFYHLLEMLVDIKRVVDYLKWNKFSLLGHSMGGISALLFCSCFPEYVNNIILLDIIKPASRSPELLPNVTRTGVEFLLNVESKMSNPIPVYSMEEAQSRLMAVIEVTAESALILLKRGCKPSSDGKGVVFSRDIRLRATEDLHKPSHDDLKVFMRRIKCNMLMILGDKSFIYRTPEVRLLDDFIRIYEQNCQYFDIVTVDGNHFVHLNNPELVAPSINRFFSKTLNSVSKI